MAARRPSSPSSASSSASGFTELGLPAALVTALAGQGVTTPFPIQLATIPDALRGRDVLGKGRTGSGKTYAFVLPLLTRLAASGAPRRAGRPRALILAPTRELADQISASLSPLARTLSLRALTVYGGVGHGAQIKGLREGVDILIACPGRLADHIEAGHADLGAVEITVIDEADHMADLGFLPAVRRLLEQTPARGQRLLFSATLDAGVDVLVRRFLHDPVRHSVEPERQTVPDMDHHVLHLQSGDRFPILIDLASAPGRTVVFTRTKHGAKALTRKLVAAGVPAVELHGNLGQTARTRNLSAFSEGTVSTLVATDIAARGIHVDDVALVIHADPPVEHKAYLHRSGRTARAGAAGTVVTLATDDQITQVRDLTRKAGVRSTVTRLKPGDPMLTKIAPGLRTLVELKVPPAQPAAPAPAQERGRRRPARRRGATGAGHSGGGHTGGGTGAGRTAGSEKASQPGQGNAATFSQRSRVGTRRGR